jgi:hypothetical protein
MKIRAVIPTFLIAMAAVLTGADITGEASSKHLDIAAKLYIDKASIRSLIGHELGDGVVVVDVRLVPHSDTPLKIWRDDFFLRSDKDGQRSEPYEPSQIAGSSIMTVTRTGDGGNPVIVEDQGPVWGGHGGSRPRRMGSTTGFGNATVEAGKNEARIGESSSEEQNKLLTLLKEKVLPEGEIAQPVSGLLYFPIEGKHKVKQLELHYRGEAAKLDLRFKKNEQ